VIHLVLPYPPSSNVYWRSRVVNTRAGGTFVNTYVSKQAKDFKAQVARIAKGAGLGEPIDWRLLMELRLYPALPQDWAKRKRASLYWDDDVRCMDLGNCEKVLSDALQGIVYTDDRWIWQQHKLRMEPDHKGARVEVRITPVDRVREAQPVQEAMQL
jgi:crossover junction endodeoxyribonuclease RusA